VKDWEWDGRSYAKGQSGPRVRLLQEMLCLHDLNVVVDGDFGPATERAIKKFQGERTIAVDGIVDQRTFLALILPFVRARHRLPRAATLGQMVVSYAEQHLRERPREVGGENSGPWVRLYTDGLAPEGSPWCAAFVCYVLRQACETVGSALPFGLSASCGVLAARAKDVHRFAAGTGAADTAKVEPGCFFLVRNGPDRWKHIGVITRMDDEVFETIEGNTNDEGGAEGYEACRRIRGYKDKDFITV
jgi:hypothetical protein